MAKNSTGQIAVVVAVGGASSYDYSTADDFAAVSAIPFGGTVLALPEGPNSGDSYGFGDVDGSCSSSHPLTIAAPSGTTIRGGASIVLDEAYIAGRVLFDASTDSWSVQSLTSTAAVGTVTLHGDVEGSGPASDVPTLLAIVNADVGTFGSATEVAQVTYDGKGRALAVENVAITGVPPAGAAGGNLTGTYPNPLIGSIVPTSGICYLVGGIEDVDGSGMAAYIDFSTAPNIALGGGTIRSGPNGFFGPSLISSVSGQPLSIGTTTDGSGAQASEVSVVNVSSLTAYTGAASIDMSASTTGEIKSGANGFSGAMWALGYRAGFSTQAAVYLVAAPGSTNYSLLCPDGVNTYVNSPSAAGNVILRAGGGSGLALALTANSSGVVISSLGSAGTSLVTANAGGGLAATQTIGGQSALPLQLLGSVVTMATAGPTVLTAAQQGTPALTVAAVVLAGAVTLDFGGVGAAAGTSAAMFDLDVSRVTFGANALTLKNGTATAVVPSGLLALVSLLRVKCTTNAIAFG